MGLTQGRFTWIALPILLSLAVPPTALAQATRQHTVEPGETLRSIAEDYSVSTETVRAANALADPDLLQVGEQLVVPRLDGILHQVVAGETLHDIADDYGVDVADLVSANALDESPDLITVGTVLVVPGVRTAAPAPTVAPPPPPAPSPSPASPPPAPAQRAATVTPSTVVSGSVSGYAPGAGASSSRTASGTTAHWGTVAADTHLYPFGTRLRIEGLGDTVFVVEDTGSAVHGKVFDVWFPDAASARALGERTRQITILGPGDQ